MSKRDAAAKITTGDSVKYSDGKETHNALVLSNQDNVLAIIYVLPSEEHSFGARYERIAGVVVNEKGIYEKVGVETEKKVGTKKNA